MDSGNILSGGVEVINDMKRNLQELEGYQANNAALTVEEQRLEKNIDSLEKSIAEELQQTVKNRREEVEAAFDQQIEKIRLKIKRIKDKRDKKKNVQVSERIDAETSALREESITLKKETKALCKQGHIPSFCNTKLYYSLYSPSCITDFIILATILLIILMLIPCGVFFYILHQKNTFYLIGTYVITVLFFGGLYVLIGSRTKEKHPNVIRKIRGIRSHIRINKKKMAIIKRNIKKDRDESNYNLQNFDEEIAKSEQEITDIATQKKEALETFDHSTKEVIISEIQGSYAEKLSGLKAEYEKTRKEIKRMEDSIKALTIKIASEYEPFIGKDFICAEQLDSLTNIIKAGNASTVSEAIAYYRKNTNQAIEYANSKKDR